MNFSFKTLGSMNYEDKYVPSELIPTHCIPPSPLQNVHLFAILSTHRYPQGIISTILSFCSAALKVLDVPRK